MGIRDLFKRRPKGREYWVRPDYRDLPMDDWSDDEYDHWMNHCSEEEYWAQWEGWSREVHDHPNGVRYLRRSCLEMALEAARETDGTAIAEGRSGAEFGSLLRVEEDTVTELVLLPGTVSGDEHAIFNWLMHPGDRETRGTLHSHPDEHPYPSDADLELFEKEGEIHLILCRPYGPGDWRAYDSIGRPTRLEVVDG